MARLIPKVQKKFFATLNEHEFKRLKEIKVEKNPAIHTRNNLLLDFARLTASVEPVETVLHGPIQDQAALNGLLARLETFGVQVLEMRRLQDRDPPAAEREPRD